MTYVAAFRAYSWDEDIATIAERFFANCPGARQVVLLDETRGPIDIGHYEKISHTIDTSDYGLKRFPEDSSLWYNGDYGIYILRSRLPGFDYYVVSESDLTVNLPIDPIVEDVQRRGIDFVGHRYMPVEPDWFFIDTIKGVFETPWRFMMFFMIISARAADFLYQARLDFTARYDRQEVGAWPLCEGWVQAS